MYIFFKIVLHVQRYNYKCFRLPTYSISMGEVLYSLCLTHTYLPSYL